MVVLILPLGTNDRFYSRMIFKYMAAWFALMVIAIINGTIREFTYGKRVTELAAHQLSTLTGMVLCGIFVWLLQRVWPLESASQAWTVGLIWLGMTVIFEFGFGHFVAGHPWSKLLADYNLLAGRLWPFFLLWILVLPALLHQMAKK